MKKKWQVFLLVCSAAVSAIGTEAQQVNHTVIDELHALSDVSQLPAYLTGTRVAEESTYDRTGLNNDGFNGNWSFIRRNADSSLVIFDVQGAGVINRFWTPTPTTDTLDFYIDDTLRPALSICYMDLFSGKVYPFIPPLCGNQLGGYFSYFPLLFQQRCVIVCRGKHMQFHQIQYRLYAQGARVKPFSANLDAGEKNALKQVGVFWDKPEKTASDFAKENQPVKYIRNNISLAPGETKTIAAIDLGGRVIGIEAGPAAAFAGLLKNIDLRIYWDDALQPAVDCPVADFFGYAFGKPSMQSLLLGSRGTRNYAYMPMPFDRKARIELVYRKHAAGILPTVQLTTLVTYTTEKRNPQTEGKLYANWVQHEPAAGQPHVFLKVKGRGHCVATLLQAQGLHPGMTTFFEGDDSTVIDGQLRMHGTGSEDYFNGGWYALLDRWDAAMSLPLHGALDYSLVFSRTGGYRFYLSDKLSFEKSIYHTIEHGPQHNEVPAIYSSVCFYYGENGVEKPQIPMDGETAVYVPDTLNIYPQAMQVVVGDETTVQDAGSTLTVTGSSKLKISLAEIPAGNYRLFIRYSGLDGGCRFSVWQRQTQRSSWITLPAAENEYLADIPVSAASNAITLHFDTPEAGHRMVLDKLMLVKIK